MDYSGFADSESRPEYLGVKQTLNAFDEALDREAHRHETELDRMREDVIESRRRHAERLASRVQLMTVTLILVVVVPILLKILGVL